MKQQIPDEITIQCPNCYDWIKTAVNSLEEDNHLVCHHCFHSQFVDVEKLLEGLRRLMEKVAAQRKKLEVRSGV
jgi:hypothetical protein